MALLWLAGLPLCGCTGYYAHWHYAPTREVHQLHVNGAAAPAADVSAGIVGVLRAQIEDGVAVPRRVHARVEVGNQAATTLRFATAATRLSAAGLPPFLPSESEPLVIARGERRVLELHFPLPPAAACSEEQLREVELDWQLELDGAELHGTTRFLRASPWTTPGWRDGPYGGDWYGDPWCDPWGPPFGWHGGAWWWHRYLR